MRRAIVARREKLPEVAPIFADTPRDPECDARMRAAAERRDAAAAIDREVVQMRRRRYPPKRRAPVDDPAAGEESARQAERLSAGERAYREVCDERVGMAQPLPPWLERDAAKARLRAQSRILSHRLGEMGHVPRDDGRTIATVGLASGRVVRALRTVRSHFIPTVAGGLRAEMHRWLAWYLEGRPPIARMLTVTHPGRVGTDGLRAAIAWTTRRVSRLAYLLRRRYGWDIIFRGIETGNPWHPHPSRQAGQIPEWHVHAHCIYVGPYLKPEVFRAMLADISASSWAHDDGILGHRHGSDLSDYLRGVREVTKYISEPAQLMELTPPECAAVYLAIRKCRLQTPLGGLKQAIRDGKQAKCTPRRLGGCWELRPRWSATRHGDKREGGAPRAVQILARGEPRAFGLTHGEARVEPVVTVCVTGPAAAWDDASLAAEVRRLALADDVHGESLRAALATFAARSVAVASG